MGLLLSLVHAVASRRPSPVPGLRGGSRRKNTVLVATLLLFSNRFQRRVRRFIDRNFYVNRYDYRTQWSNVTGVLEDAEEARIAFLEKRAPDFGEG